MNPLPLKIIAQWLPRWRSLAQSAQAATAAPDSDARAEQLLDLAEAAVAQLGGWASPFGDKRDQYVGAAMIWLAKAYGQQRTAAMRETLAPALEQLALAFLARLERAAAKLEPSATDGVDAAAPIAAVIPLRRRRDIDDMDD